ncbi:hypothetical protein NC99_01860 [Sunxiuqinia dokdonensis]|uniref:Uncharacterized protein n=1 Tax=Sunxiuqinia dokdonensis TaxID=1409788 RepID=A0A0L8VF74_9BACT|nr:hypothetical protein NC99_01860 [Sunxiuqinia dokdonensis]
MDEIGPKPGGAGITGMKKGPAEAAPYLIQRTFNREVA